VSEEFNITGDQIYFNGNLVGYLTVYAGTIREQVITALEDHISTEDRENGLDDDEHYPEDDLGDAS
tara:strand:- start:412 stop:609 length:198 start_codon:yes stop_codon:yes gene_type:complete